MDEEHASTRRSSMHLMVLSERHKGTRGLHPLVGVVVSDTDPAQEEVPTVIFPAQDVESA